MKRGSAAEVLGAFLRLGLTSFGGPIAHLGYFRREFVEKRAWLPEQDYACLIALAQFLPGPASSQVGFALGLQRAGVLGGLAAWAGFTLPSAALMLAIALASRLVDRGLLHGLALAAVAIVAQAVWTMAKSLAPDRARRIIAALAGLAVLFFPGGFVQLGVLVLAGAAGTRLRFAAPLPAPAPAAAALPGRLPHRSALALAGIFAALLVLSFVPLAGAAALFGAFYRAGALVFGGGHVVLPLLQADLVRPGYVSQANFLAGYGAAQAMPGPLFTLAAYLGAVARIGPGGTWGAILALGAIFLPGLLLIAGALPYWRALQANARARKIVAGVNAAVVGLLAVALIDIIRIGTIASLADAATALAAIWLLMARRAPPILVVAFCAIVALALEHP